MAIYVAKRTRHIPIVRVPLFLGVILFQNRNTLFPADAVRH